MLEQGIYLGDNLDLLRRLPDGAFTLIYVDPPFNTGKEQRRLTLAVEADPDGDRTGFGGRRYRSRATSGGAYADSFDDYLGFLEPRLREARRVLAREGTLYVHVDPRESHYFKVLLDEIFGRECFLNEIVWAYDYGARTKRRWPAKHDTILVYVKDPEAYVFDSEAVDREPYMAPGLQTAGTGRPREAADRCLVAHDRLPDRPREDRLPDPEAARRAAADRSGLVARGRLVPRLLRRQRHARRGRARARPPLRALRLEPRRGRGDARPARAPGPRRPVARRCPGSRHRRRSDAL